MTHWKYTKNNYKRKIRDFQGGYYVDYGLQGCVDV